MKQRTLAVVSAGLSQPSSTRLLADRLAAATSGELDRLGVSVDTTFVEVRDHAHDIMNNLLTGFPAAGLREAIDTVSNADGLIVVTPVFNASFSGLFKSFFDVLDDSALIGRPVLLAATGGSARHSLALEHAVRPMFSYLRSQTVPTSVYAAPEDWAGAPGDAEASGALADRIRRAATELAELIDRHEPTKAADPFALTTTFEELLGGSSD